MTFTLSLANALKDAGDDAERIARGTLLQLSTNVIKRTPVGNPDLWIYNRGTKESPQYVDYLAYRDPPAGYVGGSLRGAWNASIGSPDMTKNRQRKAKTGGAAISRVSKVTKALEMGQAFYLTNPLPYAYRVEFGWSTQAPEGMLRRSIAEASRVLNKEARKV